MKDAFANWILILENCKMMAIWIIDVAHLVFLQSKFCHITPFLKTLLWLPFKYCIALRFCLLNPFLSKWVLRALIDFTLSNARQFYSSMGNLLDRKGLTTSKTMSLLITFKAVHGLAPSFISNLISVKDINGRFSLRSSNGILLVIDAFIWLPLNYGTIFHFLLEIYLL